MLAVSGDAVICDDDELLSVNLCHLRLPSDKPGVVHHHSVGSMDKSIFKFTGFVLRDLHIHLVLIPFFRSCFCLRCRSDDYLSPGVELQGLYIPVETIGYDNANIVNIDM